MKYAVTFLLVCALGVIGSAQNVEGKHHFFAHQQMVRSGGFTYMLETTTAPYEDLTGSISVNNDEIWDDPIYNVSIGFPFEVNGSPVSDLNFAGLGALFLSPTGPDLFEVLAPFEADLIDRGAISGTSQSPISYKVDGAPGDRVFKLEFKNAGSYDEMEYQGTNNMFINFQMWLYEGSNMVEFRYGPSFIDDPALFYTEETGALVGLSSLDNATEILYNQHFLTGPAASPMLTAFILEPQFLEGTPAEGTVYRLYLTLPLEVAVTSENGICGLNNGSATAEANGGVEPYEYAWSNGESTATINDLAEGTYTVTVTDAEGTTATASVDISNSGAVEANAAASAETGPGTSDGTAWTAPTGGTPPYTYSWSTGSTDSLIIDLAPGSYDVTVTDANGCEAVASVTVDEFGCAGLVIEVALSVNSCFGDCNGSIEVLEVIGGTLPLTYLWWDGSMNAGVSNLCAGHYSLTVTDGNGCVLTDGYSITQPEELFANASATAETAENANDGTATVAPTGGIEPYTYLWSNDATESMITGLAPGAYSVTVTDVNGCTVSQTVDVLPFACDLTVTPSIISNACFGLCDGVISLTTNGQPPVTFMWEDSTTHAFRDSLCAGTYSVTVTDAIGCVVETSFSIVDPDLLVVNGGSTNETAEDLNDGTAWAAPTGGVEPYTYAWSNGSTDSLITDLEPGVYAVSVTDNNGCSTRQLILVNGFDCVFTVEAEVTDLLCYEECLGNINLTPVDGIEPFSYVWYDDAPDPTQMSACAGSYVLVAMDSAGCFFLGEYEITQPTALVVEAGSTNETSQGGNDGTAWVIPDGGTPPYTYAWSNGATDSLVIDLAPGQYVVTVSDANGCVNEQAVGIESFVCLDLAVVQISDVLCFGSCEGGLTVQVTGGVGPFHYLWSTGDTVETVEGLCADAYTVLVNDEGQGCNEFIGYVLQQPELLDFTVDEVVHVTDSTEASISVTVFGGTPPYAYWWMGILHSYESHDEDITGIPPGQYVGFFTDANGCEVALELEIFDFTTGVRDVQPLSARVYPNPANSVLTVDVFETGSYNLSLLSADGRVMARGENVHEVNTIAFPAGVYLLKLTSGTKQYVQRVMIAH